MRDMVSKNIGEEGEERESGGCLQHIYVRS